MLTKEEKDKNIHVHNKSILKGVHIINHKEWIIKIYIEVMKNLYTLKSGYKKKSYNIIIIQ